MRKHIVLTYRTLRDLKPAAPGKRYFVADALVPGLLVMVTATGHLSYGMKRRWPGHAQPAWRRVGDVYMPPARKTDDDIDTEDIEHGAGVLTIKEAREVARSWLDQLARGIDPKAAERRRISEAAATAERERALRFGAVAEEFKKRHLSKLVKSTEMGRIVDNVYVKVWRDRPLLSITKTDVRTVLRPLVDAGKLYQALNVYRCGSLLFNWAAEEYETNGANPFSEIKPKSFIGATPSRSRTLNDAELRAVWHVAGEMAEPHGSIVKLLILTGCRLNEIARLSRAEIQGNKMIIPGARRKRIRGKGAPDLLVPLTTVMTKILEALPRFAGGDYLFTTTAGKKPVSGFADDRKKLLDDTSEVRSWKLHDLRRTMRSHLPACRIAEDVAEAMIGHTKKGIVGVYNLYEYEPEKRAGFALWEQRLMAIVNPPPTNVADLSEARARLPRLDAII